MYKKRRHPRPSRGRNYGKRGRYNNKTFDPRSVVGKSVDVTPQVEHAIKNQFVDFALEHALKQNIAKRGYKTPTPIQDQTIPEILNGRDVVGVANTGTGKTAAFLIPLINKTLKNRNSRTLIIAPTRELAVQIEAELLSFSQGLPIKSVICIGGVSIRPQINRLYQNPNFVIGTPGRLLDLFNQRKINFANFNSVVLDEVDRMLDMGFIHDVTKIVDQLPRNRQSLFFSATLDPKTHSVLTRFVNDPVTVSVKQRDTAANVDQKIVEIKLRNKADVLSEILDSKEVLKSLIFVRTKRMADNLNKSLYSIGFRAAVMHGNKSQNQRQRSLAQFRNGNVNILIATDVASRGIDVDDISHVINFDLPESYEDYIHRIGRTGRANKKGVALSFVG